MMSIRIKIIFFCGKSISIDEINKAIIKIKANRAIGPDGVPAYVLKGCSDHLLEPLKALFDLILRTSVYPDRWKISKVIPIYKSGSKQEIKNYRPISIVCAVSKIFEVVIFNKLFSEISGKISICQHGFLPLKSTLTNLATFCQYVHEAFNNGSQVDVIYTDMEKAFDKVRHCVILKALSDMDVSLYLTKLIQSYLTQRFQYVEIKGCKSVVYKSTSGVPQGSNLGSLLFLVAINSIVSKVNNAKALVLADDFKCFLQVNSLEDCETLQNDFCNVAGWCDDNNFKLNVNKCSCMSFTLNRNVLNYDYTLNGSPLQRVNSQRDLGVVFDTVLSFNNHIISKVESAQRVAGFIVRNTKDLDVNISLHLFDSLVLPILEYGSVIWSPQYDVWVNMIENVQRKFLKSMHFRKFRVYPQRGCDNNYLLGIFTRLSLEKRRIKILLCTIFKILKDQIYCSEILAQLPFAVHRIASRNRSTFYLSYPRTNVYKGSPIYNMCSLFNIYASDIDLDTTNLRTFKKLIDRKLRDN